MAADVQDHSSDRIRAATAIVAQLRERLVVVNPLILLERRDQIVERLLWNRKILDALVQRDEDGMTR